MWEPFVQDTRMQHMAAEDTVNVGAQIATVGGSVAAVGGLHLSLPEWCAVASLTITALGFLVQAIMAVRVFRRDAEERREMHEEREAAKHEREMNRGERVDARRSRAEIMKKLDDDADQITP